MPSPLSVAVRRTVRGVVGQVAAAFPEAPPSPRLTARTTVLGVAALLAGTAVSLLRHWRAPAMDTMWAEDGRIFLTEALWRPPLEALVLPYNGYVQGYPRAVAEVAELLPPPLAANVFALAAAVVTAASAVLVFLASAGVVRSTVLRVGLALAVLLAPAEGNAMPNNVANSQWYLLFASAWLLWWRPRSRGWTAVATGWVVVTALSAPMSVALVPLAVARLVATGATRRSGGAPGPIADAVVPLAFLTATALQVLRIVTLPTATPEGAVTPVQLVRLGIQRVVAPTAVGLEATTWLWSWWGWAGLEIVAVLAAVALTIGVVRADPPARVVVLLLAVVLLAAYVPSMIARGDAGTMLWPPGGHHERGGRYVFLPVLLLVSAAAVLLDRSAPRRPGTGVRAGHVVAVVLLGVLWLPAALWPTPRDESPRWDPQVPLGRWICDRTDAPTVHLPVAPRGWVADVSCAWLSPGAATASR